MEACLNQGDVFIKLLHAQTGYQWIFEMLKKILLPTVVIAGTLMTCFGVLLVTQGSKPVEVQLENRELFDGQLKDIVTPPVGAAISFAVALGTASVITWQQSSRKLSRLEKQLSQLQNQIRDKDCQIQELKVSPTSPMLAKLDWFLNTEESVKSSLTQITAQEEEEPVLSVQPATEPVVTPISGFGYEVITSTHSTNHSTVQSAASAFPVAQSVLGLTVRQPKAVEETAAK